MRAVSLRRVRITVTFDLCACTLLYTHMGDYDHDHDHNLATLSSSAAVVPSEHLTPQARVDHKRNNSPKNTPARSLNAGAHARQARVKTHSAK